MSAAGRRFRAVAWGAGAPARLVLIGLIRLYRATLSGLLGGQCRFHPTCSAYAEQAVRMHGAVRGGGLAVWRVARCGPFSSGGVDHVPARGTGRMPPYDDVIPEGAQASAEVGS
jgi:putative membrane protein insertion efficiency factor